MDRIKYKTYFSNLFDYYLVFWVVALSLSPVNTKPICCVTQQHHLVVPSFVLLEIKTQILIFISNVLFII